MQNVVIACETQIKLLAVGLDNIQLMSEEAVEQVRSVIKSARNQLQGMPGDESSLMNTTSDDERLTDGKERLKKWKIWDLEFEAQMRTLDNAVSDIHFKLVFVQFSVPLNNE